MSKNVQLLIFQIKTLMEFFKVKSIQPIRISPLKSKIDISIYIFILSPVKVQHL